MIKHLAIIPDGNRRWAKSQNMPLEDIYLSSAEKLIDIVKWSKEQKIEILTVWGFSTDNWKRGDEEVSMLQGLFEKKLSEALADERFNNEGVRVNFIGDLKRLPKKIQELAKKIETITKKNSKLKLNILLNYGGRAEIINAVNLILAKKKKSITEEEFKKFLWTSDEPDLIIRASGEQRTSGLLAFQAAYCELYFSKKCFPEFNKSDFLEAIEDFKQRKRRFGK